MTLAGPTADPARWASSRDLFVTEQPNAQSQFLDAVCRKIMVKFDNLKKDVKFLMKHYQRDGALLARKLYVEKDRLVKMKRDYDTFKGKSEKKEAEFAQAIQHLQSEKLADEGKMQVLVKELREKEEMIRKFRERCAETTVKPRGRDGDNGSYDGSSGRGDRRFRDKRFDPPSSQGGRGILNSNSNGGILPQLQSQPQQHRYHQQGREQTLMPPQTPLQQGGAYNRHGDQFAGGDDQRSVATGYSDLSGNAIGPSPSVGIRDNLGPSGGYNFGSAERMNKRRRPNSNTQTAHRYSNGGYSSSQHSASRSGSQHYTGRNNWAQPQHGSY